MSRNLLINHPIMTICSFSLDTLENDSQMLKSRMNLFNVSPAYSEGLDFYDSDENDVYSKFMVLLKYFKNNNINVLITDEDTSKRILLNDYIKKVYDSNPLKNKNKSNDFLDILYKYNFSFPFENNDFLIKSIKDNLVENCELEDGDIGVNLGIIHNTLCIQNISVLISYASSSKKTRTTLLCYLKHKNINLNKAIKLISENYGCELSLKNNDSNLLFFELNIYNEVKREGRRRPEKNQIHFSEELIKNISEFMSDNIYNEIKKSKKSNIKFFINHEQKLVLDKISFMSGYKINNDLFDKYICEK